MGGGHGFLSRKNSRPGFFSLFAPAALSLPLLALTGSCGEDPPVGTISFQEPYRSYIRHREAVRVLEPEGGKIELRSITTAIDHKTTGGNRLALAADHDFVLEIELLDIPPRSYFSTAFGLPITDAYFSTGISAEYEILLNGKTVANKKIGSFKDSKNQAWFDERVDLEELAGMDARLLLRAKVFPPGAQVSRGWSDPRIMALQNRAWKGSSRKQPNIIVVLVDTLRADHLGCYGYSRKTSPNLDVFASESLLFETAVAPSSWTWPSTASVLTGQYPLRHGVLDGSRCTLSLDKETMAEICIGAGVKTAAFVTNPLICESKSFDQGFESFHSLSWADAEVVVDAFAGWLEQARKGRFMAYLHFMDTHGPYAPPDEYIAKFCDPEDENRIPEPELKKLRQVLGTRKRDATDADRLGVECAMHRYDAEILYWDEQFGRLLGLLKEHGLDDKTIVMVTSDHGEEFLEHGGLGHGWNLYDVTLHVPLILGGPGVEPGRVKEQVELVSLLPTILDAAGIDQPAEGTFDAPSLLNGEDAGVSGTAYSHTEHAFCVEHNRRSGLYSIRTEEWKLVYDPVTEKRLLYNLKKDASEAVDLASKPAYSKVSGGLGKALMKWIDKYRAMSPMNETDVDDETREAFEQLGYIGN